VSHTPLLIDVGQVSCGCTDHALEVLHKAIADPPDDEGALWRPHENPLIREHVERCTAWGAALLDSIAGALLPVLRGKPVFADLFKAYSWTRWTDAERKEVAQTLEGKSPADYDIEDWLLLVDLILHRYLPDRAIAEEAELLAVRANLAGKLQAALPVEAHPEESLLRLATALPATLAAAERIGALSTRLSRTIMEFAKARAAELITDVGDATRRQIKAIILDHHEAVALGEPRTYKDLESRISDQFADLNRDWRRIALTEIGRDANEGFLAGTPEGRRLRRLEAYQGACPFCRKINGMILTLVSPDKPNKDGWKEVWIGKTNLGRSASPRKRSAAGTLIEREPSELWWPAAGVMHPNCRGRWAPMPDDPLPVGADPAFVAWAEHKAAAVVTADYRYE